MARYKLVKRIRGRLYDYWHRYDPTVQRGVYDSYIGPHGEADFEEWADREIANAKLVRSDGERNSKSVQDYDSRHPTASGRREH